MATIYTFTITGLADDALELKLAMHPSETPEFLVSRAVAWAWNRRGGEGGDLVVSGGVSSGDEPAFKLGDELWVDVGTPDQRRLEKATRAAQRVQVFAHRALPQLRESLANLTDKQRAKFEIFAMQEAGLKYLVSTLDRRNEWAIFEADGVPGLDVIGDDGELPLTRPL